MKRIHATLGTHEAVFRTNNNGEYLFTGVAENNQMSCKSGFHEIKRMKSAISEIMHNWYPNETGRVKFDTSNF